MKEKLTTLQSEITASIVNYIVSAGWAWGRLYPAEAELIWRLGRTPGSVS